MKQFLCAALALVLTTGCIKKLEEETTATRGEVEHTRRLMTQTNLQLREMADSARLLEYFHMFYSTETQPAGRQEVAQNLILFAPLARLAQYFKLRVPRLDMGSFNHGNVSYPNVSWVHPESAADGVRRALGLRPTEEVPVLNGFRPMSKYSHELATHAVLNLIELGKLRAQSGQVDQEFKDQAQRVLLAGSAILGARYVTVQDQTVTTKEGKQTVQAFVPTRRVIESEALLARVRADFFALRVPAGLTQQFVESILTERFRR